MFYFAMGATSIWETLLGSSLDSPNPWLEIVPLCLCHHGIHLYLVDIYVSRQQTKTETHTTQFKTAVPTGIMGIMKRLQGRCRGVRDSLPTASVSDGCSTWYIAQPPIT